ncbi:MAG: hypothetical protein IPN79_13895 [Saprospiraceae bacterium]|nr:hypothetical protein [Saprospiraceae bacterium]
MVTYQRTSSFMFLCFSLAILGLVQTSCYERKEGCLDPVSSNFDPTADDYCADCCTNPMLQLSIKHQVNGKFYSAADTLYNQSGQSYKILDFAYYLSNIKVSDQQGIPVEGINRVSFESNGVESDREDLFLLVRPTNFDFNVNEIRQSGTFSTLSLTVGLDEEARNTDIWNVVDNHILSDSLFLKNEEGEKLWGRIQVAKGVNFSDTATYAFTMDDVDDFLLFSSEIKVSKGFNIKYTLVAEYTEWFRFVDLNLPDKLIKSALHANLKSAFRVE